MLLKEISFFSHPIEFSNQLEIGNIGMTFRPTILKYSECSSCHGKDFFNLFITNSQFWWFIVQIIVIIYATYIMHKRNARNAYD